MDYSQTPFGSSSHARLGRHGACTVDTSFKTLNSSISSSRNGLQTPPTSARDQRRYSSALSSVSPVESSYASASTPFTPDLTHGSHSFDDSGYDSSYASQDFCHDGKFLHHGSFSLPSGLEHQQLYGIDQGYGRSVQSEGYDVPVHSNLTLNYVEDDRSFASQNFANDDGKWSMPAAFGCPGSLSLATPLFGSAENVPTSTTSSFFETPALTPSVSSTGVSSAGLYNSFDFESTQLELPTAIVPSQAYADQSFYEHDHSSPLSAVSEVKPFVDADDGPFLETWAARTPYSTAAYSPVPERKVLPSSRLSRRRTGSRSQARGGRSRATRRQVKIEKFEDKTDESGNTIGVDMTCLRIKRDANGGFVTENGKFVMEPDAQLKDKVECSWRFPNNVKCTKSFDRMEHLKRHENSHTGARPFRCIFAGYVTTCILKDNSASRNDNLGDHIATHIKPAICREKGIVPKNRNGEISLLNAQALILEQKTEAEARKTMASVTNKLMKVVRAYPDRVTLDDITFPYMSQFRE
ncbi:hypothetical protein MBLNU457_g0202t1 [Dothideomycetes sp. NU457]